MRQILVPAIGLTLVLTVLTGLIYPLLVTGMAQAIFPHQANGSMIQVHGKPAGSELIGQKFTRPEYFHGRPSGAGDGYDAANSGATNLGPTNEALMKRVSGDVQKFRQENASYKGEVPADMIALSGSGLDPDISPASADAQIDRIAKARGLSAGDVRQIVERQIQGRQLGLLGEPRVNVLALNLALDRTFHGVH